MRQSFRCAALLGVLLMLLAGLAACGGDSGVPDDAVVKIGSDTIKKTAFDHAMETGARSQAQQSGIAAVPDPPNFTKCAAQVQKAGAKPAKGQPKPTAATYKAQCKQLYSTLRDQAMQFLISSAWIEGESADRGVKLSDADVKKAFDKQLAESFPKDGAYQSFLKQTGFTQEDLLYRVKIQSLSSTLQARVLAGTDRVSSAQIANYYNKNKSTFAQPEKRDLRVVLTKTEDQAKQAKAALEGGQSWKAVALKYSTDKNSRTKGGLVKGIGKGTQGASLTAALFTPKLGELAGPTKTNYGYFVVKVEKITPGRQQTLEQSEASIKQTLIDQQKQTKLSAFSKELEKKWRARTECQKGFQTRTCKNPPKVQPPPSGTATTGAGTSSGATTTNN